jgi:S-DNA-T family DNA segregation ATPase FtsK/SpoIIIE
VLTVGVTGAGKESVIWAIIAGLVPFIRAGLVNLWVIDPKGGIELARPAPIHPLAHGDAKSDGGYENSLAELLEDAMAVMRERLDRYGPSHASTCDRRWKYG